MTRGLFVTGTDTEVGKTLVAAALVHAYRRTGITAAGMKPIAAGCQAIDGKWRNEDVDAMLDASSPGIVVDDINVHLYREPIAPHIAAARSGTQIDIPSIVARHARLAGKVDAVVVEGAGGFLVPLNEHDTFADLAIALGLPVVLTVGMRLGCINHALLTQETVVARGLPFAGWVANRVTPQMDAYDENLATLHALLRAPCLGVIPHQPGIDPRTVSLRLPA